MKRVNLVYNIYESTTSILIDGKEISYYSALRKYTSQPFEEWYDKICEGIYAEIDDYFFLTFTADVVRIAILRSLAEKCQWCKGFQANEYDNELSIQQRMQKLNLLIKDRTQDYVKHSYVLTFDADSRVERERLSALDIKNRFCQVIMKEDKISPAIYIAKAIDHIMGRQAKYSFILSDTEHVDVLKNSIVFFVSKENLLNRIFQCVLSETGLRALIENVEKCFHIGIIDENERWQLLTIEKDIEVIYDTEIELYKSKAIEFWHNNEKVSGIHFSFTYDLPGIISCNGLQVEGLREGTAILYIHHAGMNKPFKKITFQVKKYNHVSKLMILENSIVMGIGDKKSLSLMIFPEDADNLTEESWKSENEKVVSCNNRRELLARQVGLTRVWCTIGKISASLSVEVKEYLQEIRLTDTQIEMHPGEEKRIEYTLRPSDAIDKNLKITTSNIMVCNVVGNCLQAKEVGVTNIVLESRLTSLRETIEVKVVKKRRGLFRRK